MIDVDALARELETLARVEDYLTPEALVRHAPTLLDAGCYATEDGAARAFRDLRAILRTLPKVAEVDRIPGSKSVARQLRGSAQILLPIDRSQLPIGWTGRLDLLYPGKSAMQLWFARWVLLRIAHEVARIIESLPQSGEPRYPFQWLRQHLRTEVDPDDPRRHTLHRSFAVRSMVAGQTSMPLPHRYLVPPDDLKVTLGDPSQEYIRRTKSSQGIGELWWEHHVRLAQETSVGDVIRVRTTESYTDTRAAANWMYNYVVLRGNMDRPWYLHVALKLPPSHAGAVADAREIESPLAGPLITPLGQVRVRADGWAHYRFSGARLVPGRAYGLFMQPGRLYS
jgi:hypothetical protein